MVRAVQVRGLCTSGVDRRIRERRGVGTHIGDEAAFVEALRHAHCALGAPAQLVGGFALQRRGHEWCRWLAGSRAIVDRGDGEVHTGERVGESLGLAGIHPNDVGLLERAEGVKVVALSDPLAVDRGQASVERTRVNGCFQIPIFG